MEQPTNNTSIDVAGTMASDSIAALTAAIRMSYIVHKEYLTTDEAQDYLGVSPTYFKTMLKERTFPVYSLSANKQFFRRTDLDAFISRPERTFMSAVQLEQAAAYSKVRKK